MPFKYEQREATTLYVSNHESKCPNPRFNGIVSTHPRHKTHSSLKFCPRDKANKVRQQAVRKNEKFKTALIQ